MNYYYEKKEVPTYYHGELSIEVRWMIFSPSGKRIARAVDEKSANEIVTLMNGG